MEVHTRHAGGNSEILWADPDLYIMQRTGYQNDEHNQPGLVYVLNNMGDRWSATLVQTQ